MNKYSYKGQIITASSKKEAIHKIIASNDIEQKIKKYENQLGSTRKADFTSFYTISGTNEERNSLCEDLGDIVGNDNLMDVNFSLHNDYLQLNYDRLTKEVEEFLKKPNFKLVFTQGNVKLKEQFSKLQDMFEKEGFDITGDMGFEFNDSQAVPLYVDHFCVVLDEDNDVIYTFTCELGKFMVANYESNEHNYYSFEDAKKKCAELIAKYKK